MSEKQNFIFNQKCAVDLHLHLDGSISVKSARELAKIEGVVLPESDLELEKMLSVDEGCRDLNEYLTKFSLPGSLMQKKKSLERCAYNLCRELLDDGFIYAEIRFAPQKHLQKGLTQKQAVESVLRGVKKSGLKANVILCAMREGFDNSKENLETVRLVKEFSGRGVCALDLAGAEALFPNENYRYVFERARALGVAFTIHSGEALGADSVETAVEFGAVRIGHGVRSAESEKTMQRLCQKRIPLEICPTSNLNTSVFENYAEIPLKKLLSAGVIVTVNSDNIAVSRTDARKEMQHLIDEQNLTASEVKMLVLNSVEAAFLPEEEKQELRKTIEAEFAL
ncbi:MAG: adenosine deaminase [Spirochaetia bacterium]|nr:adenosine deaminase [Spirochaetia bacterium]